jgi:hypothetical protein
MTISIFAPVVVKCPLTFPKISLIGVSLTHNKKKTFNLTFNLEKIKTVIETFSYLDILKIQVQGFLRFCLQGIVQKPNK